MVILTLIRTASKGRSGINDIALEHSLSSLYVVSE